MPAFACYERTVHRCCAYVGADSISARNRREQLCALQRTNNVVDVVVGIGVPDGPFVENLHSINGSIVGEGLCPLPFVTVCTALITA